MLHNNLHSFYVLFYATDGVSSGECLGSWEVSLDLKLASYSRLNEKVKRHEIESGERRTSMVNLKADTSDRPFSYLTINDERGREQIRSCLLGSPRKASKNSQDVIKLH
jgi:hypothetical protein